MKLVRGGDVFPRISPFVAEKTRNPATKKRKKARIKLTTYPPLIHPHRPIRLLPWTIICRSTFQRTHQAGEPKSLFALGRLVAFRLESQSSFVVGEIGCDGCDWHD